MLNITNGTKATTLPNTALMVNTILSRKAYS